MRVLKELAPLVSTEAILSRLGKDCSDKKKRQVKELFHLLNQQPQCTNKEMAQALFGKTRSAKHPPFLAFLEEVTWASLQEVLEPRGRYVSHPTRHELVIRCDRMITLLDTLGGGLNEAQLQLWHKLANACSKCDYVSLELECLRRQFKYYSFQRLDERKYADLEAKMGVLAKVQYACTLCKSALLQVRIHVSEGTPLPVTFDLAAIERAVDRHPQFEIQAYGGEVLTTLAMQREDFPEAIRRINQATESIRARFPREIDLLVQFAFQKLLCEIARQDFNRGYPAWQALMNLHEKNSSKRAQRRVVEAGMLLVLRCEQAAEATLFLDHLLALGGISALSEGSKGRWLALLSALQLFLYRQNITDPKVERFLKKLNRGQGPTKVYPADQISVLIMEASYLILAGDLKNARKKIAHLSPFLPGRIAANSPTLRRDLFLKLLHATAEAKFHPVAIQRKTASLQARFQKTTARTSWEALSNELISFNSLWLMITQALER